MGWQRWFKRRDESCDPGETPSLGDSLKDSNDQQPSPSAAPLVLEVTDVLDLHQFAPNDVGDVVEAYLEEAHVRGFTQVRIIHGKGIGVQRERVRAILRRTPWVVHYEEASPEAGSWGATVAWLRPHDA